MIDPVLLFISFCSNQLSPIFCGAEPTSITWNNGIALSSISISNAFSNSLTNGFKLFLNWCFIFMKFSFLFSFYCTLILSITTYFSLLNVLIIFIFFDNQNIRYKMVAFQKCYIA